MLREKNHPMNFHFCEKKNLGSFLLKIDLQCDDDFSSVKSDVVQLRHEEAGTNDEDRRSVALHCSSEGKDESGDCFRHSIGITGVIALGQGYDTKEQRNTWLDQSQRNSVEES